MLHRIHLTTIAVTLLVANLAVSGWEIGFLPQPDARADSPPVEPAEEAIDISLDELLCMPACDHLAGHLKGGRRYPLSAAPLYALCVTSDLLRPPRVG